MEKNLRLGVVSLDLIEDDLFEWGLSSPWPSWHRHKNVFWKL